MIRWASQYSHDSPNCIKESAPRGVGEAARTRASENTSTRSQLMRMDYGMLAEVSFTTRRGRLA